MSAAKYWLVGRRRKTPVHGHPFLGYWGSEAVCEPGEEEFPGRRQLVERRVGAHRPGGSVWVSHQRLPDHHLLQLLPLLSQILHAALHWP